MSSLSKLSLLLVAGLSLGAYAGYQHYRAQRQLGTVLQQLAYALNEQNISAAETAPNYLAKHGGDG